MSDWSVGDLAVCVDAKPRSYTDPDWCAPIEGGVYRVVYVTVSLRGDGVRLLLDGLHDAANPAHLGHDADRYRKIRPDEHESCEPEFITLLKRSKRKVSA